MSVSSVTKQDNLGEGKDAERGKKFAKYGWMCNELNLSSLPEDAPEGARNLAEWLTLEGRRSSLVEWLGHVKDDGRIHGRFTHIGAWTGRMAHSAPNQANIPAAFHGKVKSAVDAVKDKYDGKMRGLWGVEDGNWQVGTDASGIQLRILAHLMKSDAYVEAIVSGRKEDETDIHHLNRKALGFQHVTRDMSKTFIYAYLLGAGVGKVAEILKVNQKEATEAMENFTKNIHGLERLKKQVIPHVAEMGWFKGLDGRRVAVPSEHKALAGMLQSGEAIVVKNWCIDWVKKARAEGINFKLINIVHDETQTEVVGTREDAERLAAIQAQSMIDVGVRLGVYCPLASESAIGKNWAECH
jgi:DNA polymerase-1